ncbi:mitochondrial import inner membrane translocase [Phlyctema vagabunda]|uniref:Mitochondrial import inner membrane translocase subunit TIM50 n=1 Tax=Phlyctema vagabunda TaxID=108571 RepID=A0ABR4PG08_9HELO
MLSRIAARSLQTPALRATPTTLRSATSTVWARGLAKNNRPNHGQKKPIDYSRPPGAPASSSNSKAQPGAGSSTGSGKPDFSNQQDEFSKGASPTRNNAPQPPTGASKSESRKGEDPSYSGKQEEFETASPSENTVPEPNQPLPDLTQGIPSTLEYETAGSKLGGKSGLRLNLTEADEPSEGPGSSGRTRGELPASAYISSSEKKRLRMANYMYGMFAVFAATGTVYLGRNWETEEEEKQHAAEAPSGWALGLMWNRAKARVGDQLNYYHEPAFRKLLPDVDPMFERPYTLVLSLEDLLIHSEWTREHGWRMAKRPGVDYFLRYLSQYYELVIFTSQPWAVAEPVLRKLDPYHIVTWPLFREATMYENGEYVKDLAYLNRDLSKVILIDTKADHAKHQPENAIILPKWTGDSKDKELVSLIPFLEYIHTMAYSDVRKALKSFEGSHIPSEFAAREAVARKKFQEQMLEEQKKRPKRSGVGFLSNALGMKPQSMMVDPNEQTPAEAFAQGKMLQDLARERGIRNYENLEREIRENGEKWLKEEAAQEEKAKEEGMKAMKSGFTGWFGGAPPKEGSA